MGASCMIDKLFDRVSWAILLLVRKDDKPPRQFTTNPCNVFLGNIALKPPKHWIHSPRDE